MSESAPRLPVHHGGPVHTEGQREGIAGEDPDAQRGLGRELRNKALKGLFLKGLMKPLGALYSAEGPYKAPVFLLPGYRCKS